MSQVRLDTDHHVHSTFSADGHSSVAENLVLAGTRGMREVCLADHVRADTTWVPEYLRTVRRSAAAVAADGLAVHCAVEVKMLDSTGRLDLPADLPDLDRVLIADHQYPSPAGPLSPETVRRGLDSGDLDVEEVVEVLVLATVRALARVPRPQLAHLFSLLPKIGLTEADVHAEHLDTLAGAARDHGAVVEANEKWDCPHPAALTAFAAAGVTVVPGTDSHRADDIGRYPRVAERLAAAELLP